MGSVKTDIKLQVRKMFTIGGIELVAQDCHVRRIQPLIVVCHLMESCVLVRDLSDYQIYLTETHCVTIQSMYALEGQLTLNLEEGKMNTINKLDLIC